MQKFTIKNSCDKDWGEMKTTKNGKFCDHCNKVVLDLTNKDETEVNDFLSQKSSGSVCAKMLVNKPKTYYLSKNIGIAFSAMSLLFASSFSNSIAGQTKIRDTTNLVELIGVVVAIQPDPEYTGFENTDIQYRKFNVWIKDKNKKAISKTKVQLISLPTLFKINSNSIGNVHLYTPLKEAEKIKLIAIPSEENPSLVYFHTIDIYNEHQEIIFNDKELHSLQPKNIARKEYYYLDGEEVSYDEFIENTDVIDLVEWIYIPSPYSSKLKYNTDGKGLYLAYRKNI